MGSGPSAHAAQQMVGFDDKSHTFCKDMKLLFAVVVTPLRDVAAMQTSFAKHGPVSAL